MARPVAEPMESSREEIPEEFVKKIMQLPLAIHPIAGGGEDNPSQLGLWLEEIVESGGVWSRNMPVDDLPTAMEEWLNGKGTKALESTFVQSAEGDINLPSLEAIWSNTARWYDRRVSLQTGYVMRLGETEPVQPFASLGEARESFGDDQAFLIEYWVRCRTALVMVSNVLIALERPYSLQEVEADAIEHVSKQDRSLVENTVNGWRKKVEWFLGFKPKRNPESPDEH